jgi:hypothetical protein
VGGVGDEAAQPRLRRPALGERRLDLAEHGVQGQPQPADLGGRLGRAHAPRQVAGGDRPGGGGDAVQGAQAHPHEPQRQQRQHGQHGGADQHLDQHQAAEGLEHPGERHGHGDHRAAAGDRAGLDPVGEAAASRRVGGEPDDPVGQVPRQLRWRGREPAPAGPRRPLAPPAAVGVLVRPAEVDQAHPPAGLPDLDPAGLQAEPGRPLPLEAVGPPRPLGPHGLRHLHPGGGELLVDPADQERPQRQPRRQPGGGQADRGQREHRQQQAPAQRHQALGRRRL